MEGEQKICPNKRQKTGESLNDFQQIILMKDRVIEKLSMENDSLKKKVDELVKTIHGSFFMKKPDCADQQQVEGNEDRRKKNKKKKISPNAGKEEREGQAKADAGPTNVTIEDDVCNFTDTDSSLMDLESSAPRAEKTKLQQTKVPDGNTLNRGANKNGKKEGNSKNVPIITSYNINVKDVTSVIDRTLGHKNFNLRIMGRNATNIGLCTLEDFEKVKHLLKERGVNFYTYTPKGQKPFSVVIEGLSGTYTEEDIREHLGELGIRINILGLVKLNGDRWLLRLSRDSDLPAFYNLRYVLRCRVFMRKYKRNAVTQCFNCQRFGHVSTNCQMPYRCVKCGASHGPGKCNIPKKGENTQETLMTDPVTGQAVRKIGLPVRCVNCGVDGHVASSKECPRRVELLRKVEQRKVLRGQRDRGHRPSMGMVRPGVSYASAVASTVPGGTPTVTPRSGSSGLGVKEALSEFSMIDGDCKRFFGDGLLSCLHKMGDFAREYRGLKDDESKSRALLGMLMILRQYD